VRSSNAPSLGSSSTSLTTIAPAHTAQSEAAIAANRSFVATRFPFEGQIDQANARYAARATIKATKNAGTTIGGTNQLVTLARPGRPGAPPSSSRLSIAADGGALLSEWLSFPYMRTTIKNSYLNFIGIRSVRRKTGQCRFGP
jgi:hypothetical protein